MAQTKATISRKVFQLKSKQYITPHYLRITLNGDVSDFEHSTVGDNNKIFIPPKGVNEVQFPVLDPESKKMVYQNTDTAPFVRTYTHKGVNLAKNELYIDFVNHGDNGPASSWAIHAELGDKLGVAMRTAPKELYPSDVDWFLLVGDATAIPVLGAILEDLSASSKGVCVIQVSSSEDIQELPTKASIEFHWIVEENTQDESRLVNQVKCIAIPSVSKFGYVACEFSAVKQIRNYLRKELKWISNELYAYSYWKNGVAEDRSAADRQAEKKSIA
ncbi:Siderophore-interacting protein [Galbibacter marinus]|uniref:Siderophore-interacting protein n=1 Tax=Galbibacter marinus TaxID=555500 RepID=K2Q6A2_9FLAO|nr:siderophore-interacting protein [Galbibacter marinus]EKF56346.1 Siderophore-interacting protein [Galbibacter marinus]